MTLDENELIRKARDEFAKVALPALIQGLIIEMKDNGLPVAWTNKVEGSDDTWADVLADDAYAIADAMLERKRWDAVHDERE
jgi:hypothetical protein